MNFSMVFSAVDKASKVMGKIMASEKKMAGAMKSNAVETDRATKKTGRAMKALGRSMSATKRLAAATFSAIQSGAGKASRAVSALHRKTIALGKSGVSKIGEGSKKVLRGLTVAAGLTLAAYGGAAMAANSLVGTASDFEKFQTILETTEGSSAKAQKAMDWVTDFAVKTPYELDQVTDAFVKMRAYGLDPTNGLLNTLGDTSAAMGKPLMQAVEAVADAVTGENERLKEFGITASKTGSKITYAYTNAAGEAVKVAVKASDRAGIQNKLMAIMNEKYAGSMARLSQTWDGMMSNLSDQWLKFQLMIMESGLFDWMKGKLKTVLDTINQMEADGSLQEWATNIGTTIKTVLESAWNFANDAYAMFNELSGYLSAASDYVGGWKNLGIILAGIAFAPTLIATAAGIVQIAQGLAMLSAALMANPITLAIAAIAGGVYLIYDNWDTIGPYFQVLWDGITSKAQAAWEWLKGLFDWVPSFSEWTLPSLSTVNLETAWSAVKTIFKWSPLGLIIENFGPISEKIGNLIGKAADVAGSAWARVKGVFSSESAVDIAVRDPASLERANNAAEGLKISLNAVKAVDMSGVSNAIKRLKGEAANVTSAVKSALSQSQSFLAGQSFHYHGVRLMDTMAAGMKARAQVVVDQIKATMQQVRDHLPSSPAKVGPLSDIHRLKFGETIATSIKAAPMIKAMRAATAATMIAATPHAALASMAQSSTPTVAAQSLLPLPSQARSTRANASMDMGSGQASPVRSSGAVSVTYGDIHISGDAVSAKEDFKQMLRDHSRTIADLVDEANRHKDRRKF